MKFFFSFSFLSIDLVRFELIFVLLGLLPSHLGWKSVFFFLSITPFFDCIVLYIQILNLFKDLYLLVVLCKCNKHLILRIGWDEWWVIVNNIWGLYHQGHFGWLRILCPIGQRAQLSTSPDLIIFNNKNKLE